MMTCNIIVSLSDSVMAAGADTMCGSTGPDRKCPLTVILFEFLVSGFHGASALTHDAGGVRPRVERPATFLVCFPLFPRGGKHENQERRKTMTTEFSFE